MDPFHVHRFGNITSFDHGHTHRMFGSSGPEIPSGGSHVHEYQGFTTLDDGHTHFFHGISGPSVPLLRGGHTHQYTGMTSVNRQHQHHYSALMDYAEHSRLFKHFY
ncbi:MAG: hypothetical protein GX434_09795 [Peptococcaceae bacterium]|nr:hypothetical protein [Peptococcaceae bacterium]